MSIDHVEGPAPVACTLNMAGRTLRFAEIAALAERAILGHEQDGRTLRLRFAVDVAADLERLVELERKCCSFLEFEMHKGPDAVRLSITAPVEAGEFTPLLYSHFVGQAPAVICGCSASCGCGNASPR